MASVASSNETVLINGFIAFQMRANKVKLHSMNEYIDIYCERLEPGLLAEPLNAVTNIAFFIAAFFAFKLAKERNVLGLWSGVLIFLLTAIGVGSSLFHTVATFWAQLADVLPILLFQVGFIIVYSLNVVRLGWMRTLILLLVFSTLIHYFESLPREWLNGSLGYAPAFIFLSGFGIYHWLSGKVEPFVLLISSATFIASLTFRSLDMAVCEAVPFGIHFMWHILNSVVLYLALRGLFLNLREKV